MIVVLCDEMDASAHWVVEALRTRGHAPRVLTGLDLVVAETWDHRVGQAGADCEIRLAGGTRLRASAMQGVLNRLSFLPSAWLRRYGGPDRDYAIQEMHAFYLSWLHALPGPVLNPPTPQGLAGNWRHPSAWIALAVQAGLPVRAYSQTSRDDPALPWQASPSMARVLVVGAQVLGIGAIVEPHREACLRLSRAAGAPLLGIDFAQEPAAGWQMTGATVMPDLAYAGTGQEQAALADALSVALAA